MPAKFDSCVDKVKSQGGLYNPYAVCNTNECEGECSDLPFQNVYSKNKKEAVTGSSMPQLGRSGVQNVKIK